MYRKYIAFLGVFAVLFFQLKNVLPGVIIFPILFMSVTLMLYRNIYTASFFIKKEAGYIFLFFMLYFISTIRLWYFSDFEVGILILLFYVVFAFLLSTELVRLFGVENSIFVGYLSLYFYVSLSFLLYFFDFSNSWLDLFVSDSHSGQAKILGYFGIKVERVFFYFSGHPNSFSLPVSVSILLSLIYLFDKNSFNIRAKKILFLSGIFIGTICMLLIDSRGAMINLIIVLLFYIFVRNRRVAYYALLLSPFYPFVIYFLFYFIRDYVDLISLLRNDDQEFTFNNRLYMWLAFYDFFKEFHFSHLFGYGLNGQIASGIVVEYQDYFSNYKNNSGLSLHNGFMQLIVDFGYIGFLFFYCYFIFIAKKMSYEIYNDKNMSILFYAVFFIFLYSGTEIVFSPRSEIYFIYVLFFVAALTKERERVRE